MTTTLITGANKGLGLETARQLVAAGHTVYVGSRDAELGRQVADELGARAIQLDITDDASVQAAAAIKRSIRAVFAVGREAGKRRHAWPMISCISVAVTPASSRSRSLRLAGAISLSRPRMA